MELLNYLANQLFKGFSEMISSELSAITEDPFAQIDNLISALYIRMKETEGSLKLFHTHEMLELIFEHNLNNPYIDSLVRQITVFIKTGIDKGYFRPVEPQLYGKIIFSIAHDLMESAMLFNYPGDMESIKLEFGGNYKKNIGVIKE